MTLGEIKEILHAELLTDNVDLSRTVQSACASDMMSDVLAFTESNALLLTGLMNPQTIRTCEIAEASAIVFVRGKRPTPTLIALANEKGIPLLRTDFCMYDACGRLHEQGLCGVTEKVKKLLVEHG
ncbi:MAG: DRTGG domain-containing protein [Candidatus Zhuqueibacterota bacterium]